MNRTPGHGRRRSTRNKTIAFDPKTPHQDSPVDTYGYENFSVLVKPKAIPGLIDTRSYNFLDLMSAFRSIENKSSQDPQCVSNALKRFKTNEETSIACLHEEIRARIEYEMFPKIMNNPFLRNDLDVPVDRIEKNSKDRENIHGSTFNRLG